MVVRGIPLNATLEPELKLLPLTVNTNPPLPTDTDIGDMLVIQGAVAVEPTVLTVNVCTFEVPPPGVVLNTLTVTDPVLVISEALRLAVSWFGET